MALFCIPVSDKTVVLKLVMHLIHFIVHTFFLNLISCILNKRSMNRMICILFGSHHVHTHVMTNGWPVHVSLYYDMIALKFIMFRKLSRIKISIIIRKLDWILCVSYGKHLNN